MSLNIEIWPISLKKFQMKTTLIALFQSITSILLRRAVFIHLIHLQDMQFLVLVKYNYF